jgi:hypothetical protein
MADIVTGLGIQIFDKTYTGSDTSKIANVTSGKLLVDAGIVSVVNSGTQLIAGTQNAGTVYTSGLITVQGTTSGVQLPVTIGEITSNTIAVYNTAANVTTTSSSIVTYYNVTAGTTFYLKEIIASASSGPVKVIVEYAAAATGASSGTYAVGFFSSANPTITMPFYQPIAVTGPIYLRVTMKNDSAFTQDLYATIIGRTI